MKFRERDIQPLTFTAQGGGGGGGEVRSSVQEEKCKQRMAEGDFPLELHRKSRAA